MFPLIIAGQGKHTSSSRSKKARDLASLTKSNAFTPVFATDHPRRPAPPCTQPGIPLAHGTEKTRLGTWSFPETVMASKSGKPSRFASPSLKATGKEGVNVVSCTSNEGVLGKRDDIANRTNAYISGTKVRTSWQRKVTSILRRWLDCRSD